MRLLSALAIGLLLASCAARGIERGMNRLVGQPITAVIERLGVPTQEQMIAGQKVYTWFSGTFDEGTQLKCVIRVMMNGDVVGRWDFEGNNGYCMRYARRLGD